MQFLIIDDNPNMIAVLSRGLREHGYASEGFATARAGEDAALSRNYDVVVLDRMLPDKDGVDVCRDLRTRGLKTPILMLTGLTGIEDRVRGLNAGADDYLAKPFDFEEFMARSRALMRRGEAGESARLTYADVEIDLLKRSVSRAGKPISFRRREFELLEFFVRRCDRVLERTIIAEHVWDMNYEIGSNVIDVYVSALRRKIDRDFDTPLIHTVVGVGYMFSTKPPGC